MLDKMRKPIRGHDIKKIVYTIIFGFICLIFVFIGVWTNSPGISGSGTAATVNGAIISAREFQDRLRQFENEEGPMHGLSDAEQQKLDKRLRIHVLRNLVHFQLLYQAAKRAEVFPTVDAIRDIVVSIPAFQSGGRFDREYYQEFLNNQQMTAGEFEGQIGQDVAVDQLNNLLMKSWSSPGLVGRLQNEVQDTKVDFNYVKIDTDKIARNLVTKSEVSKYLSNPQNVAQVRSEYQINISKYLSAAKTKGHKTIRQKAFKEVEDKIARQLIADTKKEQINTEFADALKSATQLKSILLKYHLKWQNGGSVSAADSYIAKLGLGDEAITAVLTTPPGHVYGNLLPSGGYSYIVEPIKIITKPKTLAAENATALPPNLAVDDILNLWVYQMAKNSTIHINKMYLK